MRRIPYLALALVGLSAGCTVSSPATKWGQHGGDVDAGSGGNNNQGGSGDMAEPPPEITTPQLDTYDQTTVFDTVPIRGTALPVNGAIIITAMDGTPFSAKIDSAGRFCADLPLQPNKANKFQLKTHDSTTGNESATISLQVNQSGQPNGGSQGASSYNASSTGAATTYQIGTNGSREAHQVTDGDKSTYVEAEFEGNWFSHTAVPSVAVRLQQATSINKIVAVLPPDCQESGNITLAYSTQSTPPQPDEGAAGWIKINGATKSADGKTFSANINPASATYVAAWFGSGTSGCSTIVTSEYGTTSTSYGFAELQAWSTPGATVPPPTPPMCGY